MRDLATKTWHAMKRTAKAGQRRTLPDMQVRGGWVGWRLGGLGVDGWRHSHVGCVCSVCNASQLGFAGGAKPAHLPRCTPAAGD